jgi:hypothetical protein
MRHFATLTMLFAWLLYGAMPALGACPMCSSLIPTHSHSEMNTATVSHANIAAGHGSGDSTPCDGAMGHASFCPACLVLPGAVAIDGSRALTFSYPAPGLVKPLRDARPAPASPPPRLA